MLIVLQAEMEQCVVQLGGTHGNDAMRVAHSAADKLGALRVRVCESMCMCVYVYASVSVCMRVCVYICVCVRLCVSVSVHV